MKEDPSPEFLAVREQQAVAMKDDYPKWLEVESSKRTISFELTITLDRNRDIGFFQVVEKQLELSGAQDTLVLLLQISHTGERAETSVVVKAEGKTVTDITAQEVLKKLQSSKSILFYNSTQVSPRALFREGIAGFIREISGQHADLVSQMKKTVDRGLARISKTQQAELEQLLGRLQTKYKVGLSTPDFNFDYLPYSINLGERKFEVPLDDWGSGTKNRTLILLTLFRARQISESAPSASKVTPVIIIEEPESFLHPSAQAELGRVLQALADEFQVQVIVTTHSPYLLNVGNSASNILLRRRTIHKNVRDTECVDTTGSDWMAPFGQALGLDAEEFRPWKDLILSGSDAVLLVEGETDKEYLSLLQKEEHGANRLVLPGEVVSYEGTGNLSNTVLLRFIKNRYRKLFVTFDLDAADHLEKTLQSLQLEKYKHFAPVGVNAAGKKNIEGLLPESVITSVYGNNASLVQAATEGTKEEKETARRQLKKKLLEEFKRVAKPGPEYFGNFYPLVRIINKALS